MLTFGENEVNQCMRELPVVFSQKSKIIPSFKKMEHVKKKKERNMLGKIANQM